MNYIADALRGLAIRHIGFPLAETVKHWPLRRYLNDLQESQWLSPAQIRDVQNQKLVRLMEHAYATVPFYRDTLDQRGLKPKDIQGVDDLPKLPILTKNAIRAAFPDRMVSSSFDQNALVLMSSSGSTGEPFKYYLSQDEKARKWAGLFRFWTWAGWELGDRYATLGGFPLQAFKGKSIMSALEGRFSGVLSIPAFNLYDHNAREHVDKLVAFKPCMLRGYASSLHHLATILEKRGEQIELNAVCSTGETLFDFQRELVEQVFQTKVYDGYGGEGMEVAGECDRGKLHINDESLIVEIVDPEGNRCAPGTPGQIVLTDLNRISMPFIRYNIQDIASVSDEQCSCGRGLTVMDDLSGRLTDVGITPSGKVIVVHFFTGLFMKLAPKVESFLVVQEQPDTLVVSIVPGQGFEEVRDTIRERIQEIRRQ